MSRKPPNSASPPPNDSLQSDSDLRPYLVAAQQELTTRLLEYLHILPESQIWMGKFALSGRMKLFSLPEPLNAPAGSDAAPWPLFVLLSCQAAFEPAERHNWPRALPASVAVEIAIAAADLLDEITDNDPSPFIEKYGVGQALNTGNLMLVMAQQILQSDARREGGEHAIRALGALQDMLTQAAVGQHLDMLYENMGMDEVTLEMSARMIELKAGALISGAYRIGALMAGADDAVVELLARYGREMGCIAQIANDVQDVLPHSGLATDTPQHKTDLKLRKRTIPIVFTLRDDSPEPNALRRAYALQVGQPGGENLNENDLRRAIMDTGGVQFANLLAEVHLQNALDAIEQLEALRPGARDILRPVLPR